LPLYWEQRRPCVVEQLPQLLMIAPLLLLLDHHLLLRPPHLLLRHLRHHPQHHDRRRGDLLWIENVVRDLTDVPMLSVI